MTLHHPADAAATADCLRLVERLGPAGAAAEAALNAEASRDRGNAILFCRWRQVERLAAALATGAGIADTRH